MARLRLVKFPAVLLAMVVVVGACSGSDTTVEDAGSTTTTSAPADTGAASTATTTESDSSTSTSTSTSTSADSATDTTIEQITGSGCGETIPAGQSTVSFEFEDRDRVYELYVPMSYDPAVETPLVLNWHGLGSNGPDQLLFSDYIDAAERHGFLVAAPTGVPGPGDSRNSWELTDDSDGSRDDLAFAGTVMDRIIAEACVDEARIYTTGMSNGGYFSSRLICELGDRIAAAASVAALTYEDDCSPERPVPYIAFHGVDDLIVPFDGGGESSLAPGVRLELFERVIPDEFGEFAAAYGCDVAPDTEVVTAEVTTFTYQGCPEGVEAVFYRLEDAGHTWPGSQNSAAISETAGLGVTNTDIDATELSWEFFSRHQLG